MKLIAIFKPEHNKIEQKEIRAINTEIWKKLADISAPNNIDGNRYFVRHSIKIVTNDEGEIITYDTTTEPFMPIYNRYILKLLLVNILDD